MDEQAIIILAGVIVTLLVLLTFKYMNVPDGKSTIEIVKQDTRIVEAMALLVSRVDSLQATVDAQVKLLNSVSQEVDQAQHHMAGLRKEMQLNRSRRDEIDMIMKSIATHPIPVRIVEPHVGPLDPALVTRVKKQLKNLSK